MRHYPEHLLLPHKAARWRGDYYTFSPAAAHLLSLVSGVERDKIERAKIYGRSIRRPFPWYGRKSYGGITMPAGDGYAITFTGNLFDPDRLGRNYYAWLNIASHEVGHINHIDESNRAADAKYRKLLEAALYSSVPVIFPRSVYRLGAYFAKFAQSYIASGGHDASPLEAQAERRAVVFGDLYKFVSRRYGAGSLTALLRSDKTDEYKISLIDKWWKDYHSA